MKNVTITIILVLLIPTLASAIDLFGIGPRAGYVKGNDADESAYSFGGAVRLKLLPTLGIEGAVDYRAEKYSNGSITLKSRPVQASLITYPLPIVYALFGVGWYNTTYDFDQSVVGAIEDREEQDMGWHFGGGLELPFGPLMTLAGDIRYTFLKYDFSELPGSPDLDSDFYTITLTILFGL